MGEAEEHQDRRAILAIDMFCYRVKKYLGAYMAEMNGTDAICFAGGIGENAAEVRRRILAGLDWFGIEIDDALNRAAYGGKEMVISSDEEPGAGLRHPDQRGTDPRPRHRARRSLDIPSIW